MNLFQIPLLLIILFMIIKKKYSRQSKKETEKFASGSEVNLYEFLFDEFPFCMIEILI